MTTVKAESIDVSDDESSSDEEEEKTLSTPPPPVLNYDDDDDAEELEVFPSEPPADEDELELDFSTSILPPAPPVERNALAGKPDPNR
jgi:hypothetical protein